MCRARQLPENTPSPYHPQTTVDGTHNVEIEVINDGPTSPQMAGKQKVMVKRPNDPCAWPKNCVQNPRGISTDWQQFLPRLQQAVRDIKQYVCKA